MSAANLYEFYMHKYGILYDRYLIELKRQSDRAGIAVCIIGCIGVLLTILITILVALFANLDGRFSDCIIMAMDHYFLLIISAFSIGLFIRSSVDVFGNLFQSDEDIQLLNPMYISTECTYKNVDFLESVCKELSDLIVYGNEINNYKNKLLVSNIVILFMCVLWLFIMMLLGVLNIYPIPVNVNMYHQNDNVTLSNASYLLDKTHNSSNSKINSSINKDNLSICKNSIYEIIYGRDPILIQNILMLVQRNSYMINKVRIW